MAALGAPALSAVNVMLPVAICREAMSRSRSAVRNAAQPESRTRLHDRTATRAGRERFIPGFRSGAESVVVIVVQRILAALVDPRRRQRGVRPEGGQRGGEFLLALPQRGHAIAELCGGLADAGCLGFDVLADLLFGFARERARNGFARGVHAERRASLADRDALHADLDELPAIIEQHRALRWRKRDGFAADQQV